MSNKGNNDQLVIRKKDPTFSEHLDFDFLRKEGIAHISELSGKIWTDHNRHDPGITILEMLCYALLDLGYRTSLPIEDLLALKPSSDQVEDNFFSPAEILSCNPTTILDYRKMLIDIEGVRNAWLEIADDVFLYLNCDGDPNTTNPLSCDNTQGKEVPLNGLYRVFIEVDENSPFCRGKERSVIESELTQTVKSILCRHRNLCEDFIDVCVLCESDLGVCANIDLDGSADPESTYVKILAAIANFLAPAPTFYTLQEILDKGKSIEEAFEGRPYTMESYGFVDSAELNAIQLRKEVHVSDIYHIIMDIEGVRSVRDLKLSADTGTGFESSASTDCGSWKWHVGKYYLPKLCIDRSCLNIFKGNAVFNISALRSKVLFEQSLSTSRKVKYNGPRYLDLPIPSGQYRQDLGDYYSIQNDFPKVYGIGEGGLSVNAPDQRKAQALQLKGYLLFFDQLLSGYLAQLDNLRQLFSMRPDSQRLETEKHTQFIQNLDTVPEVSKLLKYYDTDEQAGKVLAVPVSSGEIDQQISLVTDDPALQIDYERYTFDSRYGRDAITALMSRDLEQGEYQIEIHQDTCGYFFVIQTSVEEVSFVSADYYDSTAAARVDAESVTFLGALSESYRSFNRPDDHVYSFDFVSTPVNYLEYAQNLAENKDQYLARRNQFLDHLLARFSESFTDLSVSLYQSVGELVEAKGQFVSVYPFLSRNRGRGFDYCDQEANEEYQISGLEARVGALAGFGIEGRQQLCHFRVEKKKDEWQIDLLDPFGKTGFQSLPIYTNEKEAQAASSGFLQALQDPKNFLYEDDPTKEAYHLYLEFPGGLAKHSEVYSSAEDRDMAVQSMLSWYSPEAQEANTYVSSLTHQLFLCDKDETEIAKSKKEFADETKALKGVEQFTSKINQQLPPDVGGVIPDLSLEKLPGKEYEFVNTMAFHKVRNVYSCGFQWYLKNEKGEPIVHSETIYSSITEAAEAYVALIAEMPALIAYQEEDKYGIQLLQGKELVASQLYNDEAARDAALQNLETFFKNETNFETGHLTIFEESYQWELKDEDGWEILQGNKLFRKEAAANNEWQAIRKRKVKRADFRIVDLEDGYFQVELLSEEKKILGTSRQLDKQFQDPGALIKSIIKSFRNKDNKNIIRPEQSWAFHIPNPEPNEDPFLSSYLVYPDRYSALKALELSLPIFSKKKSFVKNDDKVNLDYSFHVQDENGDILAFHPTSYDNAAERDKVLDVSSKAGKKFELPLFYQEKFCYQYLGESGDVWLESTHEYNSVLEAEEAFEELIPCLVDTDSFDKKRIGGKYVFSVVKNGVVVTETPNQYPGLPEINVIIDCIKDAIEEETYTTKAKQVPKGWKYQYWGRSEAGEVGVMVESKEEYQDKLAAETAYTAFVSNLGKYNPRETKKGKKTSYALSKGKSKKAEAVHPVQYEEEQESQEAVRVASATIEYSAAYQQAASQSASFAGMGAVQTGTGGEFCFEVMGKGEPLAYFPCECFDSADNPLIKGYWDKLCVAISKPNPYPHVDICMGKDAIIKIGLQYHFQLKDHRSGKVYFVSYEGFDTQALAIAAFHQTYLQIIALASEKDNYPVLGVPAEMPIVDVSQMEALEGKTTGYQPLVYIPDSAVDPSEYETWAQLFYSYPIRQIEIEHSKDECESEISYEYCFHLIDESAVPDFSAAAILAYPKCVEHWKSTKCYPTAAEAWTAYNKFRILLQNKANFALHWDEEKCCYHIAIKEVLLQGTNRFKTRKGAWGEPLMWSDAVYESIDDACKDIVEFNGVQKQETVVVGYDKCQSYYTRLEAFVKPTKGGQSPQHVRSFISSIYKDLSKMQEEILQFIGLIQEGGQFCVFSDDDCNPRIGLFDPGNDTTEINYPGGSQEVLLAKSRQVFTNMADGEAYVQDFCDQVADASCVVQEISTGSGIYKVNVFNGAGGLSFIGEIEYSSQAEAETACSRIEVLLSETPKIAVKVIEVGPGQYSGGIVDVITINEPGLSDDCESSTCKPCASGLDHLLDLVCDDEAFYPCYDEEKCCYTFQVVEPTYRIARHPFDYHTPEERAKHLEILCKQCLNKPELEWSIDLQGDPSKYDFYISNAAYSGVMWEGFSNLENTVEDEVKEAIHFEVLTYAKDPRYYCVHPNTGEMQLCRSTNKEEGICEIQDLIAVHKGKLSIEELVKQARGFPYFKTESGYGFQVYCPEFPLPEQVWDDSEPCDPCPDDSAVVQPSTVLGAVIWESIHSYETLEEAQCYYKMLCELQLDKSHIKNVGDLDCKYYSFELTNPQKIVATHPQCYPSKEQLEEAIEQTKACLNVEGMHLLEHILLRPRSIDNSKCTDKAPAGNCDCLLPSIPDCDCAFDLAEVGHYRGKEADPLGEPYPERDGYQYIPGSDPYSFWATVLLPCWPKRFRKQNFRSFFQEMVLQETPAHIGLNFVWISPSQMCDFEDAHQDWLDWLSGKDTCRELEGAQERLVRCLSYLESCCAEGEGGDTGACDCEAKPIGSVVVVNVIKKLQVNWFNTIDVTASSPVGIVKDRIGMYQATVANVANSNIGQTKTYQATSDFINSEPTIESYTDTVKKLLQYGIRNKGADEANPYYGLLQQATYYYLDKQVEADPDNLTSEDALDEVFKSMKEEGVDLKKLAKGWKGKDLQEESEKQAVNKILNRMK